MSKKTILMCLYFCINVCFGHWIRKSLLICVDWGWLFTQSDVPKWLLCSFNLTSPFGSKKCTSPFGSFLFAHQGFGLAFLSEVLDIPYPLFTNHFDMCHTGMTVIEFREENGVAIPKVLTLSSDAHLYREGLPTKYNNNLYFWIIINRFSLFLNSICTVLEN